MVHPIEDPHDPRAKGTHLFDTALMQHEPWKSMPPPLHFGHPVTGYFTGEIFRDVVLSWVATIRRGKSKREASLVVIDGWRAHTSREFFLHLVQEHSIHVVVLPPHLTQYAMPNDHRGWHGVFKKSLRYELLRQGGAPGRHEFLGLLGDIVGKTLTPEHAISAFRGTGVVADKALRDDVMDTAIQQIKERKVAAQELYSVIETNPHLAAVLRLPVIEIYHNKQSGNADQKKAKADDPVDLPGWVTNNARRPTLRARGSPTPKKRRSGRSSDRTPVAPRVAKLLRLKARHNSRALGPPAKKIKKKKHKQRRSKLATPPPQPRLPARFAGEASEWTV